MQKLESRILIASVVLVCCGCQQIGSLWESDSNADSIGDGSVRVRAKDSNGLGPKQSADACVATADELANNGWDQEAIVVYERALSFDPDRPSVKRRLARLHARAGNTAKARELFEASVTASPKSVDLLNDFGFFLLEQGDVVRAEATLRRALEVDPNNKRCQVNLALTLAADQRFDECLAVFEQAVGPAAARSNVAVLLTQHGDHSGAKAMLAEARGIDPTIGQANVLDDWLKSTPHGSRGDVEHASVKE